MAQRDNPYGAFNFMVRLGTLGGEDQIVGGFSDVSGLGNEVKYSEYRNGNDQENHVRKVANTNTTDDVTLKRGVIGDLRLFTWLKDTREGTHDPQTVTITLLDEARAPVCSGFCSRPSPRSGSGRRSRPRAGARWRWRSCSSWPSGSTSSRCDRTRAVISGLALETPGVYHVAGPLGASVRSPDALDETGFVGVCWRGPVQTPVSVASWSQFVDVFGSTTAPDGRSCPGHLPVAVRTFFDQGGRLAWVVRVAPVQEAEDAAASVLIPRLGVELVAASEGTWGAWLSSTLSFDVGPPLPGLSVAEADDDELAVTVSLGSVVPPGSLLLAGRTRARPSGGLFWLRSQHVVAAPGVGRAVVLSLEPVVGFRQARPLGEVAELRIITATLQTIDRDPLRRRSEVLTGLGLHPDHPRRVERVLREESLLVRAGGGWDQPLLPPDSSLPSLGSVPGAPGRDRFAEIDERSLFDDDTPDGDLLDERTDHRGVDVVGRVGTLGLLCVPDLAWSGDRLARGLPAHLDSRTADDLEEVVRRQVALVGVADRRKRFVALIDAPAKLPAGELTRWRSAFASSFAAAYHPWLGVPAADPRAPADPVPPTAFAAGIIAARERRLGLAVRPCQRGGRRSRRWGWTGWRSTRSRPAAPRGHQRLPRRARRLPPRVGAHVEPGPVPRTARGAPAHDDDHGDGAPARGLAGLRAAHTRAARSPRAHTDGVPARPLPPRCLRRRHRGGLVLRAV